jgi:hypothetical protein
MSNRNKSVAPYKGGVGGGLVPKDHFRNAFDDFDRMADNMMANFGMPKMDLSKKISFSSFSDALRRKRSLP